LLRNEAQNQAFASTYMSFKYSLAFKTSALKEWKALAPAVRDQFKKKLTKRLDDSLFGLPGCYKIKLKSVGYRLVYQVEDDEVLVTIVAVGRFERSDVYSKARYRM
jgi:mRNA interferase RelE/StbE